MSTAACTEDLLRELAPRVLGGLVRRHGQFDMCEDAVQEALVAAATEWPERGLPDNPHAWLATVAARRMTDEVRRDRARRRREDATAMLAPPHRVLAPAVGDEDPGDRDDTLTLLFLCCHPALTAASQIALTLRAVGGLTTAEIANAFFVPEATMAQRVSRAKQRIKTTGIPFGPPPEAEWAERLRAVLHVLYLIFNEGYATSAGPNLLRGDLTAEAIRLTRAVHQLLPDDGEVAGLLALMLLTDARSPARTTDTGALIPLAAQDRHRWDRASIDDGVDLITRALPSGPVGPYQLQAAIAAVHDEAADAEDTDWLQILALYDLLERVAPNPIVTLNRAVAVAMVRGPQAGLEVVAGLEADGRLAGHHRLDVVRAHLLEMTGDRAGARARYRAAARHTTSGPEKRYLDERVARLSEQG